MSVRAHWTHWPCLLPRHGLGDKHLRKIELVDWQQEVVAAEPKRFPRGLLHSDGSRFINRTVRNGKTYTYPRYAFVNESTDIMARCGRALDSVDISRRMARPNTLPVARTEAVARLDEFVGPQW